LGGDEFSCYGDFLAILKKCKFEKELPINWKILPDFGTKKLAKKKTPAYGQKNQPPTLIL
jgi:hypothetical protein